MRRGRENVSRFWKGSVSCQEPFSARLAGFRVELGDSGFSGKCFMVHSKRAEDALWDTHLESTIRACSGRVCWL